MTDITAIVIGSGFGGAVSALRLGEAGIRTIVLERGRRWTIKDPTTNDTFATFRNPDGRAEWLNTVTKTPGYEGIPIQKSTGVLEVIEKGDYKFLVGSGVGGGSLAYGGILIQPPKELFEQVFPNSISYEEMDAVYFPRVHSVIGTSPIPDDVLESEYYLGLKILEQQALKSEFPYTESSNSGLKDGVTRFPMGVDWDIVREEIAGKKVASVIAAEFWFGNNSGGKKTLDSNYLKLAEATGNVEIRTHHLVTKIAQNPGSGYAVSVDIINDSGDVVDQQILTCQYLFVAAGTMGTCDLLIKAKAKGNLPRINDELGQGFGNDGDTYAFRTHLSETTNPHLGGPGAIAVLNYQNPILPCVMMRAPLPRFEQDFPEKNVIGTFVFAMTNHRGNFSYDRDSDTVQLNFTSDPKAKEAAKYLAEKLSEKNGGEVPPIAAQITGHQVGGACMGRVCDEYGRVFGYPNLYVVDGSLLPGSSTCVNPALTIAAIAERCLDRILAQDITP
ncbi:GMC oxidoreductase [Merismopedia glauca]|uniref:Cholesterol oxidase n=1 Tax=Merismopedia glauca CCAP 1448/3 TaxID=1296344 RepID=A0A2T1C4J2_9CYAN|nr:GMC oxidoreductase [Merismopedia glauca]PSB03202.1 GMC family oxidoreductase [Merismopedia glauca CCAP 1448/3]